MALVNCPECNKENISDTSISCPNCGFNIKQYYDNKSFQEKQEKYKLEQEKLIQEKFESYQSEIKREQEKIDNMPLPEEPSFLNCFFKGDGNTISYLLVISLLLSLILGLISKSSFLLVVFFLILIIGLPIWFCIVWSDFSTEKNNYYEIVNNFDEHKRIKKEQIKNHYLRKAEESVKGNNTYNPLRNIQNNQPKCPLCQSTNIKNISTINRATSVAVVGLASSKIGKQWECKNCGNKF